MCSMGTQQGAQQRVTSQRGGQNLGLIFHPDTQMGGGERVLMGKQMTFWKDKGALWRTVEGQDILVAMSVWGWWLCFVSEKIRVTPGVGIYDN